MSDERDDWRWANTDGVIKIIDEWELVSSLSNGQIPAEALVWRTGWAEWLPAAQVPELASAVPAGQRRPSRDAARDPARTHPPPVPVGRVQPAPVGNVTRPPPKPPVRSHRPVTPPATLTPLSSTLTPLPGNTRPSSPSLKLESNTTGQLLEQAPMRPQVPTLIDMPGANTATLRPPGAVPPPPRAVPPIPRTHERLDKSLEVPPTVLATPIPNLVITEKPNPRPETIIDAHDIELTTQPSASIAPISARIYESNEPATDRKPAGHTLPPERGRASEPAFSPTSVDPMDATLPSTQSGPSARAGAVSSRPSAAIQQEQQRLPTRYSVALFLLGSLAALLAVAVVVLLLRPPAAEQTHAHVTAPKASVARSPERSAGPGCTIIKPPERIAEAILASIPPHLAEAADSSVTIGFAENRTRARGVSIDLPDLTTKGVYSASSKDSLVGVVPITNSTSSRQRAFALDGKASPLKFPRTIDADPPFVVGMSGQGFARSFGDKAPELIWAGGQNEPITEVRVARAGALDYALTFRRGGQTGEVLVGYLGADGSRKSELKSLQPKLGFSGMPALAANEQGILVAYAARPNTDVYWAVHIARANLGALPGEATQFAIPPGGPGAEAISPAVAGLQGGRWLLQWTEGSTGARRVRAQVLAQDLAPRGSAFTLSAKDQNAGQGALWVQGDTVLALFLVSKGHGHELWGSSLKCP